MANKINLLKKMQQEGIWHVDASIVGMDGKHKPAPDTYRKIVQCCWNYYIANVVAQAQPFRVVIIGRM